MGSRPSDGRLLSRAMQRTPPELTSSARALRAASTEAERKLWLHLRAHRPRFTRQLVVGHFIIDIACRSLRIAIELDGGHHAEQVDQDAARTAFLEAAGWHVLRYWNNDVIRNVEGVLAVVVARASTHPHPLPCREGSRKG